MGSIGTVTPSSTTTTSDSATSSSSNTNDLSNQSTFLSLLVAQLQNQDPTDPVDGTSFITELAEFNDVEQNMGVRQDMDAVSMKYLGTTTPPSDSTDTTTSADSTSSTSPTTTNP